MRDAQGWHFVYDDSERCILSASTHPPTHPSILVLSSLAPRLYPFSFSFSSHDGDPTHSDGSDGSQRCSVRVMLAVSFVTFVLNAAVTN